MTSLNGVDKQKVEAGDLNQQQLVAMLALKWVSPVLGCG
jgi:hypothetical protein